DNERRESLGGRIFGRDGAWDYDVEPTIQFGRFGKGLLRAWALEGEVGYRFAAAMRPRVSVRYNFASGDRACKDADLETFNPLQPRGGALGEVWNFAAGNLSHIRIAVDLQLAPGWAVNMAVDGFRRTSTKDGIYGTGGNVLVPANLSSSRDV